MLALLLLCFLTEAAIKIGLVTSPYTDHALVSLLSSSLPGVTKEVQISLGISEPIELIWLKVDLVTNNNESKWSIPSIFLDHSVQTILDAGNSIRYSSFLADQSLKLQLLHVVISRWIETLEDETTYPNTLYAETCYLGQATAVLNLLTRYNWQNIGLILDKDTNNAQMAAKLKSMMATPMKVKDQVIIDIDDVLVPNGIAYRLQSTTRDSGARVIVVMADTDIAAQVLRAADKSVMGGVGFAWILNSDSMMNIGTVLRNSNAEGSSASFGVLKTGAIGLLATDSLYESNEPMSTYLRIITLICQGHLSISNPTGTQLYNYIMSNPATPTLDYGLQFDSQGLKLSYYNLYNVESFAEIYIGSWNPTLNSFAMEVNSVITWPGFTKSVPNDKVPILQLGLLYPGHDILGNELSDGKEIKNGFDLAISEINADPTALSGYQIQPIYVDTFSLPSLASANLRSLSTYNIIGFVGPKSESECLEYLKADSTSTDPKPMVTYWSSSTGLSDSINYPQLLQIVQPDGLQAVALTLFIQLQGWKTIGVIYSDDEIGQSIYTSFLANVGTLEVTIKNSEAKRVVNFLLDENGNLSSKTKSSIDEALTDIVRNQIKVIVYLGNTYITPELARVGYKKELHGSDYSWIGTMWLTPEVIKDVNTNYANDASNIFSVLNGATGLGYRGVTGSLGSNFSLKYLTKFNQNYTTLSMLTYDTVYTYASVIQGMITRGDDYNGGTELTNSLRSADLTGASGKIKFSEGSNGRSAYGYNIINLNAGEIINVLEYDPLNPNLFTSINNTSIVWGGGSSTPAIDEWPNTYDCPFAENMSTVSPRGVGIIIAIGSFLFILTLILSYFSYNKWKQIEISPITVAVTRSWKDTLVQAQIAIEFFQFVAIAPAFNSMKIVIEAASNIFMLDIMKVASTTKGDYWILLSTVCALCYMWFILVLIIMLNGEHWLKKIPFCRRTVSILNSVFLPFYGNTFFLPALALLLDMFVCDHKAQGKDYVWRDCYTVCWEGKHANYIVMSVIAIICYEPVAAYSRPLWQQSRTGLNLKIQPFFLLLKTCMQILLIAIGKSLQSTSPLAHGVVFTILITAFAVMIYKLQPFNYNRCNLWEFSSIIAVAYLSFMATLSYSSDPNNVAWFIALAVGWGIIAVVSFIVQKKYMPNLLIPPGGARSKKKIYDIIAFKDNKEDFDESNVSKVMDFKLEVSSVHVERVEADKSGDNVNLEGEDNEASSIKD